MILATLAPQGFPPQLREIPEPPAKLYIRGALPPEGTLYLAVVGSRKYTNYGKEVCEKIIQDLRGYPLAIVSGLAIGMDSIAHRAALDAGLPTVAIPGSGLDPSALYPATNRALAEKIVQNGGALLSEFEPDFKATIYSFPQRNRLMAGISRGVLIIEAAEKSGTLITARLAMDYNRDVFAVPSSIFSPNAAGALRLLKEGAAPVTSGEDILLAWGLIETTSTERREAARLDDCSDAEREIMELLREPSSKDDLIRRSGLSAAETNTLLSALEIKGLIKETMGEVRARF
ncbi:MAG: DNA-protecting protein DprA [Parcubacteria group bacterium]|nr:DNA-protecting protein DprA [Parcubacteria group bacterium]